MNPSQSDMEPVRFTEKERRAMYGAVNSQRLRFKRNLMQKSELGVEVRLDELARMARLERICDKLTALQAETHHDAWVRHGRPTTRPVKSEEALA